MLWLSVPARVVVLVLLMQGVGWTDSVQAAGIVEMEIVTDPRSSALVAQRWTAVLSQSGVSRVRIRASRRGDKVQVTTAGTDRRPVYQVMGSLDSRGTLNLPGGRFQQGDRSKLRQWVEELKTWGPQGAPQGQPAYGLNAEQLSTLLKDLSQPVVVSTSSLQEAKAFDQIVGKLQVPVELDRATAGSLRHSRTVGVELQGLASGTALAYVLRPSGLVFRPQRLPSGEIRLLVQPSNQVEKPWSIGVAPEQRDSEILPVLLEFLKVEIEPTPLAEVLPVIQGRVKVPFLIDQNQLVKHRVDISQVKVSHPSKKTWYQALLRHLLRQAQLKHELRLDEAGKPFLWITTLKP